MQSSFFDIQFEIQNGFVFFDSGLKLWQQRQQWLTLSFLAADAICSLFQAAGGSFPSASLRCTFKLLLCFSATCAEASMCFRGNRHRRIWVGYKTRRRKQKNQHPISFHVCVWPPAHFIFCFDRISYLKLNIKRTLDAQTRPPHSSCRPPTVPATSLSFRI